MAAGLAAAIVLASAGAVPAAPQRADVPQLVRDACVETGMRRDAFERLARQRRWRQARTTSHTGPAGGWNLFYRGEGAVVMLTQVREFGSDDPSLGSVCTVSVERAEPALGDEVAALAASLELDAEGPVTGFPGSPIPIRSWSRFGDVTLSYAAAPDGRATVSLSRQIVTTETAPASPPGN
ncbi:hypothetical protein [Brevundimonas sp.]|uniref:hypothetical protein n=1 Tax=Brevundimonas sp. TaxID=1871086 RepID=UPI002ED9A400